jgi:NADH:ubiquinone oxidoreductase subunit 4 (subunit M)
VVHVHRWQTGTLSFDYPVLIDHVLGSQQWLLFLAFATRVRDQGADVPVPHWLPDAHVEAPTPGR